MAKGIRGFQKGHPCFFTEESRKKIGDSKRGEKNHNFGKKFSEETRRKMSDRQKGEKNHNFGKKFSEEYRKKISDGKKGEKNYNFGKHLSKEHKEKLSKAWNGKKTWNWNGGITKIDKRIRGMVEYIQWRSDAFQRDNWTCKTCGKNGCYVTVHHKKSFKNIIQENNIKTAKDARNCKELWDIDNGVTLCENCHKLTDNYKGRANSKKNN
jgi:hypothetical protein